MKKFLLSVAIGAMSQTGFGATHIFQGESVEIPESGPADPSFIYVEGVEGVVVDITVKFYGFSHRYGEETMIALSNPDGWATLIYDGPDCVISNADLVFNDEAEASLGDVCISSNYLTAGTFTAGYSVDDHIFTIPIAPIRPLYATLKELILPDPNGRWILWSEDYVGGDGGTLTTWEIIIETEDPA